MCRGLGPILTALDKVITEHISNKLTLLDYQFNNIMRIYIQSKYFIADSAKITPSRITPSLTKQDTIPIGIFQNHS